MSLFSSFHEMFYLRQKFNNKMEMNFIEIKCDYIIFISCFIIKWYKNFFDVFI